MVWWFGGLVKQLLAPHPTPRRTCRRGAHSFSRRPSTRPRPRKAVAAVVEEAEGQALACSRPCGALHLAPPPGGGWAFPGVDPGAPEFVRRASANSNKTPTRGSVPPIPTHTRAKTLPLKSNPRGGYFKTIECLFCCSLGLGLGRILVPTSTLHASIGRVLTQ